MHAVVGFLQPVLVDIERVGVLHDELARAHHAKARPDLVAELRLNLVIIDRQLLVAAQFAARDIGNDLFVRRSKAVFPVMAIMHAQQQGAVLVPAARLFPELGGLHGGHQQLERTGAVHFLAHHGFDLAQHAQAQRHPGEQAR